MAHKVIINDQRMLARREKKQQTASLLNGKQVADLKPSELAALVEILADHTDLLDDQNRIRIPGSP